ncbi:hypothetical protein B4135_2918 [Caldibacillus debilis]|uniref:Uncharacterized protein n=1 Tax=Caldibacillus debilis TaxID=301148 RepID=A0A150LLX5_9BACI|nr:hypothetical protein B4135_2918 [Caldibacillus debilis]
MFASKANHSGKRIEVSVYITDDKNPLSANFKPTVFPVSFSIPLSGKYFEYLFNYILENE